jgi:transcriptional regulator with XRE-family HTH domain
MADEDDFGAWIRTRLTLRGLSQRQLSARTGVHHSTISRLLRGEHQVSLRTALVIQAALARDEDDRYVSGPDPLHPAALFTKLRSDGRLSDHEIAAVVRLYARLLADKPAVDAPVRSARGLWQQAHVRERP